MEDGLVCEMMNLTRIKDAQQVLNSSPHCLRTPMLHSVQKHFGIDERVRLHLKLENLQKTGSFKIRGVTNQMQNIPADAGSEVKKLVTMSAGNYGKAFGYMTSKMNLQAKVIMPSTAPLDRVTLIKGYGAEVEQVPTSEILAAVDRDVERGMHFLHSYDDLNLIAGHASAGLEILEECPAPDVVVCCCGGGGLLAGVASAIKLSGNTHCRVYGVEPQGAPTMYESFKAGHAVTMPSVKSIASGLSPPSAGENAYDLCREHVEEIILVSEDDLRIGMSVLYDGGLVVEPAGAAAFTALYTGKIPDVHGKTVVVLITGGNVSSEEMCRLIG